MQRLTTLETTPEKFADDSRDDPLELTVVRDVAVIDHPLETTLETTPETT